MSKTFGKSTIDIVFDLVIYAFLILMLLITAYPLFYVLSASFSDPMAIISGKIWLLPKNVNLDAYRRVFSNDEIMIGYKNSIIYTVTGTLLNIIMTTLGAYPLSRKNLRGRTVITFLFSFTMFFNGGLIPAYIVFRQILGLYNNIWAMIIPGAINMWNLIIMRTYFQNSIPEELHDASYIDGCSNIGTLMRIVLPLSKPIIAVLVMYYGVTHWNSYFNALILLDDQERMPLQMILRKILVQQDITEMSGGRGDSIVKQLLLVESLRFSVIVVASVPVLMIYPFIQKYFVKGVMVGAVKG